MPMIDVYAPVDLLPAQSRDRLRELLVAALLTAEGAPVASPYLENTGVFFHDLPASAFGTCAQAQAQATALRLVVTTPPSALTREAQKVFVEQATNLLAAAAGDPALAARTWVTLTEAAEGGWGVSGFALGQEDFAALRAGR
jgi:phenylpyruvate tautomerase PptA (4-oxalocrotonate tautomerase family)